MPTACPNECVNVHVAACERCVQVLHGGLVFRIAQNKVGKHANKANNPGIATTETTALTDLLITSNFPAASVRAHDADLPGSMLLADLALEILDTI